MQLILPDKSKPGRKSLCLLKAILEALERGEFHKLKAQYSTFTKEIKSLDEETNAALRECWFEQHVYCALRKRWIIKVWEFDVPYKLPKWAFSPPNSSKYKFIYDLTYSGTLMLDKLRTSPDFVNIIKQEQINTYNINNQFNIEGNYF